jgi:hypothetical protein
MKKYVDKYLKKIILVSALIMVILASILIYFLMGKPINVMTFENTSFTTKYDTTWKIEEYRDDYLSLKHGSDSVLEILIKPLPEDKKYNSLDSLIEEIEYGIVKQNETYSLIAKEKTKITAKNIESHKFLYEKDDKQVLIIATKIENKIVLFTYFSNDEYYDILLDSAYNIIHNFELNKEKVELKTNINKIDVTDVKWSGNTKVTETKEYRLAYKHFIVDYKLPEQFKLTTFDNTLGQFRMSEEYNTINLSANIMDYNIYEWLNVEKIGLLQYELKYIKENYDNVKVESANNSLYEGSYIYKISYDSYSEYTKNATSYGIAYLVYPLDKAKVFVIKIETRNFSLSNDIIDNINIINNSKIADYIYRNIDNGFLVNELKAFTGNENEYYKVKLYTPEVWREKATSANVFETRKFGFNCSSEIDNECEYNLSYSLVKKSSSVPEEIIKVARDDYADEKPLYTSLVNYDGKSYESYSLEYEKNVYGMKTEKRKFYETILFQKLDDNLYLVIKLNRMDKKDDLDHINNLLKFEITKEISN